MSVLHIKLKKNGAVQLSPVVGLFVLVLIILSGVAFFAFNDAAVRATVFKWRLDRLNNADYSSLVSLLVESGRYDEASKIADFVVAHPEMPGRDEITGLKARIRAETRGSRSVSERARDMLGGFMSGGGDSTEERIGGLISNLLLSAGLPVDSLSGRAANEADAFVRDLSASGLGVDAVWFPALMGTISLSGLMTDEYEEFISTEAERSASAGKPTAALRSTIRNTRRLVLSMGASSIASLFKGVHDARDIALLADWGERCPEETFIVASLGGMDVFSKLPEPPEGIDTIRKIARKGSPAVESARFWLK